MKEFKICIYVVTLSSRTLITWYNLLKLLNYEKSLYTNWVSTLMEKKIKSIDRVYQTKDIQTKKYHGLL